jgi:hypothetical protein
VEQIEEKPVEPIVYKKVRRATKEEKIANIQKTTKDIIGRELTTDELQDYLRRFEREEETLFSYLKKLK